jgi:hypothetical protein
MRVWRGGRWAWLGAGLAGGLAALALGGCGWVWVPAPDNPGGPEATAPSVGTLSPPAAPRETRFSRRMPGTPVANPFRAGEEVAVRGEASVNAGMAGKVAYLYTPDFTSALVSGSQERTVDDLAYAKGDWRIECGRSASPWTCRLAVVSLVRNDGRTETALRVRYVPGGPGLLVCAGGQGATGPAIQPGEAAEVRYGGLDGCFDPAESADILDQLSRAVTFGYHYTDSIYGDVSGWRTTFGLPEALELMQWLQRRAAGS